MSKKLALTKRVLESLTPPSKGRMYVRDSKTPGLVACVSSTGTISLQLYRWGNGRPVRITLGRFPQLTIEQARGQAIQLNAQVNVGANPNEAKRARRGEMTFGELFEWYMENHARPKKKTWQEDDRQHKNFLRQWDSRHVSEISRADVQALHVRIGSKNGKYAANRVLALVKSLFNHGAVVGFDKPNPCRGIKKFQEQSRERFLQADELPAFFAALEADPNETLRDFFKVALLTGVRRANVQEMRWADLNIDRGTWTIPMTKNGSPQTVALSPEVIDILRVRHATTETEWVFAARNVRGETGHVTSPKTAWKRVCEAAGLQGLRIHDLRRTLGSWQAASGASLTIIGKSLGHKNQSTTAIYARLNLDSVRESVGKATAAILAAANGKATNG